MSEPRLPRDRRTLTWPEAAVVISMMFFIFMIVGMAMAK